MTTWEYTTIEVATGEAPASGAVRIENVDATKMLVVLNELGALGWEMAGVVDGVAVLKRPVAPERKGGANSYV